jgi:hypothetical protein
MASGSGVWADALTSDASKEKTATVALLSNGIGLFRHYLRHCEPTGRREAPPDDRLREAIHSAA